MSQRKRQFNQLSSKPESFSPRVVVLPLLFSLFCWGIVFSFERDSSFISFFPVVVRLGDVEKSLVKQNLPPYSESLSQTWELAQLQFEIERVGERGEGERGGREEGREEKREEEEEEEKRRRREEILEKVSLLLGKEIDSSQMEQIPIVLKEMDEEEGVLVRILGFFSFLRIVMFLSVLGIALAIGPVLYFFLGEVIVKAVVPFVAVAHQLGLFECLAYFVSFTFVVQGLKHPGDSGMFISLLGLALSIPSAVYSISLHTHLPKTADYLTTFQMWLAITWTPLAIAFDSTLIGFLSVGFLFGALGFSGAHERLTLYIGFKDDEAILRVCVTSTIILFLSLVLRGSGVQYQTLRPFASSLQVLGALTLLLGLFIFSSIFYRKKGYIWRQLLMIVALLALIVPGSILGMKPLTNTALVFFCLFVVEKWVEFGGSFGASVWFIIFTVCLFFYQVSLYLHLHPEIVVDFFEFATLGSESVEVGS